MWLMNKNRYKIIDSAAEYIHVVFGIACEIVWDGQQNIKLPYYLKAGNLFVECFIEEQRCLFMVTEELPDGSTLAKRVGEISNLMGKPVILVMENIDSVRRRMLITNRTSFIVPGKQAYLPFMGALLTERGMVSMSSTGRQTFSPAAQVLLLTHLQKESFEGKIFSEIAKHFPYSVKTVAAAAKELGQAGICMIEGDNSGKYLHWIPKVEIWDMSYPWLTNPVQDVLYCDRIENIPEILRYVTYDKALAEYTFMADSSSEAFAVYKNDDAIKKLKNKGMFNAVEGKYRIELWKYNPALMANDNVVDALSLALCYKECGDERVMSELTKLINRICKD